MLPFLDSRAPPIIATDRESDALRVTAIEFKIRSREITECVDEEESSASSEVPPKTVRDLNHKREDEDHEKDNPGVEEEQLSAASWKV